MGDDAQLLLFTVSLAGLTTLLLLPVALPLAWWLSRPGQSALKALVETVATLPLVLPPTAVGLLLLSALSSHSPVGALFDSMGVEIVFTWRAVLLATWVMSLPLLLRSARTAFEELDPRLLGVARTLGATPLRVFVAVAIPLAWRGLLAGVLLSFCRAVGEFGATILIAGNIPGRTQTLSLAIFQRAQSGDDAGALRLVAVTVALAFGIVLITEVLLRRRPRSELRRA